MKNRCKEIMLSNKNNLSFNKIISIKKISTGTESIVFLVKTDRREYILKLNINPNYGYENEVNVINYNKVRKLAPKVYCSGTFKNSRYVVGEFIKGKKFSINNKRDIILAAKFFTKLHGVAINKDEENKHFIRWWGFSPYKFKYPMYMPKHILLKKRIDADLKTRYIIIIDKLKQFIKTNGHIFKGRKLSFIHGDAKPENLILLKNHIIAVDWRWAGEGYFANDVADFFVNGNFNFDQRRLFLKNYNFKEDNRDLKITAYLAVRLLSLVTKHVEKLIELSESKPYRGLKDLKTKELILLRSNLNKLEEVVGEL